MFSIWVLVPQVSLQHADRALSPTNLSLRLGDGSVGNMPHGHKDVHPIPSTHVKYL